MFRPVSSKADFAKMEEGVLRFWKENDIFQKSIEPRDFPISDTSCPVR